VSCEVEVCSVVCCQVEFCSVVCYEVEVCSVVSCEVEVCSVLCCHVEVCSVVCCQVEVCATVRSLARRSPTKCCVSEWDHDNSTMRRPRPIRALEPWEKMLHKFTNVLRSILHANTYGVFPRPRKSEVYFSVMFRHDLRKGGWQIVWISTRKMDPCVTVDRNQQETYRLSFWKSGFCKGSLWGQTATEPCPSQSPHCFRTAIGTPNAVWCKHLWNTRFFSSIWIEEIYEFVIAEKFIIFWQDSLLNSVVSAFAKIHLQISP